VTSDDRNRLAGELGRNVWERRLATSDATLVAIEIGDAELSPGEIYLVDVGFRCFGERHLTLLLVVSMARSWYVHIGHMCKLSSVARRSDRSA
jgi:hypothetical protein